MIMQTIAERLKTTQVIKSSKLAKILLVDYDATYGRSLEELLLTNGYAVHFTLNTSDAAEIIVNTNFDIIIIDINTPGISCSEFIKCCKSHRPLSEIIVTSWHPEFLQAVEMVKGGAFDYIGKARLFSVIEERIKTAHHHQINHLVQEINLQKTEEMYKLSESFPDYKIISKIEKGATGTVVLASRENFYYALKLLSPQQPESEDGKEQIQRFLAGAKLMSKIEHPNVVKIFESGLSPHYQIPYILMEYVDGGSLENHIKKNSLQFEQKIRIIMQTCAALHFIHKCGIIHRDIKPANIMLSKNLSVKLTDFGIARPLCPEKNADSEIIGSPSYMAPESFLWGPPIDQRSDIFSLGVVAYELLTGEKPFSGISIKKIARAAKNKIPVQFGQLPQGLPATIQPVLKKMLSLVPETRFSSAEEVTNELGKLINDLQPIQSITKERKQRHEENRNMD
ncbi:MAG: protein kinase [Victivallaceae bacterium]